MENSEKLVKIVLRGKESQPMALHQARDILSRVGDKRKANAAQIVTYVPPSAASSAPSTQSQYDGWSFGPTELDAIRSVARQRVMFHPCRVNPTLHGLRK